MSVLDTSTASRLGRSLRMILRLFPPSARLPILRGPARGLRWIVGSSTHGCWLGSYEHHKQRRFADALRAGMTAYDVGAHAGLYTLIAARKVGESGAVIAVEPFPPNLELLRRHVDINRFTNVRIVAAALGDVDGSDCFTAGPNSSMGRLSKQGDLAVKTVSLDSLVRHQGFPPPDLIKMDIEGGEGRAIRGALDVLRQQRPSIFLSTHGAAVRAECVRLLEDLGYQISVLAGPLPPDPNELVALQPKGLRLAPAR